MRNWFLVRSRMPLTFRIHVIPIHSIGSGSPLSIRAKFPVAVTVLPFLSFTLIGTSVYHPNDSVIYLELLFIAKSDDLSTFHPRALIVASFTPPNSLALSKKELVIDRSFILQCKYCKDENHSSVFDSFSFS